MTVVKSLGIISLAHRREYGSSMLQFSVNGEARQIPAPSTVLQLLESMQLVGKRIAVERNGDIVPKGLHATTSLADGDVLEIVVAVGGG